MKKLIYGLTKKLIKLLDENEEIFYEEHPFLLGGELAIIESDKRYQNDIEIQKTVDTLLEELEKDIPEKTYLQGTLITS